MHGAGHSLKTPALHKCDTFHTAFLYGISKGLAITDLLHNTTEISAAMYCKIRFHFKFSSWILFDLFLKVCYNTLEILFTFQTTVTS